MLWWHLLACSLVSRIKQNFFKYYAYEVNSKYLQIILSLYYVLWIRKYSINAKTKSTEHLNDTTACLPITPISSSATLYQVCITLLSDRPIFLLILCLKLTWKADAKIIRQIKSREHQALLTAGTADLWNLWKLVKFVKFVRCLRRSLT